MRQQLDRTSPGWWACPKCFGRFRGPTALHEHIQICYFEKGGKMRLKQYKGRIYTPESDT